MPPRTMFYLSSFTFVGAVYASHQCSFFPFAALRQRRLGGPAGLDGCPGHRQAAPGASGPWWGRFGGPGHGTALGAEPFGRLSDVRRGGMVQRRVTGWESSRLSLCLESRL